MKREVRSTKPWRKQGFLIGERDYRVKMKKLVEPLLAKYKKEGDFRSFDGRRIHYHYMIHPQEKAAIVISHGFCEFVGKYYEMMYYFYKLGYSVFFIEHRGHGYSERTTANLSKVYVRSFHEYVADMNQFVERIVKKKSTSGKYMLYAHSMGGAIATMYLEKYPKVFSKAVLSAPMLEMRYGDFSAVEVRVLLFISKIFRWRERYIPGHHDFNGIYNYAASSSQSKARYKYIFQMRLSDEHYQTCGSTYSWARAGILATEYMKKHAHEVKTPILLCQAGKDSLVQPGAQRFFANESWRTHISRYPTSKHEIYNSKSRIRKAYYNEIFTFLEG